MSGRIVLFGATGYTGRLVAGALARAGVRPVLAGRGLDRLERLAADLGGADHSFTVAQADSGQPDSLRRLLDPGDVLVTTVGPFAAHGEAAVRAATDAGASYLDSTGEPPFVARVFREWGPSAEGRSGLLTAFGYDYVPGNLAGAIALDEAPGAERVDVGYFVSGAAGAGAISTGTLASAAGVLLAPGFAWRDGRMVGSRSAASVRTFRVAGRPRDGVSVSGSEHFALPRLAPRLREVNVYLGWFSPLSRVAQAASAVNGVLGRLPGADRALRTLTAPLSRRTGGGPDATRRARVGSEVVAVATDGGGRTLAEVHLQGPNPYDLTGDLLAWGARRAADGGLQGTGALGPVDAFGLDALTKACADAGLVRV